MKKIFFVVGKAVYCFVMFVGGTFIAQPRSLADVFMELGSVLYSLKEYAVQSVGFIEKIL